MPAAAKKANAPKETPRQALCRELLEIERDNATMFARIDTIKAALKLDAKNNGKFREIIAGLGHVSASPETPERIEGEKPVLVVDAWQALKQSRRDALTEQGLVAIQPIVKGAYYGRVEAKLTNQGAAA